MPQSMQRDTWSLDDFHLSKELYRGRASIVYVAVDKQSATPIALKVYRKRKLNTLNRYQIEREIRIHIALEHDHIIKLYSAFEDEKLVYLVQELAVHGDLYEVLRINGGLVKEKYAVRDVLAPFLSALSYLHDLNIIHRDIKPENLLMTSANHNKTMMIKVADFGLSIDSSIERPITRCGTLDYLSPEVLICPDKARPDENKELVDMVYGPSVDVWGIGCLAYELLVGSPPFAKESRLDTHTSILNDEPQLPSTISSLASQFILAALQKNPSQRPTVVDLLKHPWIQQYANFNHLLTAQGPAPPETVSPTTPQHRLSKSVRGESELSKAIRQCALEPQRNLPTALPPSPKSLDAGNNSSTKDPSATSSTKQGLGMVIRQSELSKAIRRSLFLESSSPSDGGKAALDTHEPQSSLPTLPSPFSRSFNACSSGRMIRPPALQVAPTESPLSHTTEKNSPPINITSPTSPSLHSNQGSFVYPHFNRSKIIKINFPPGNAADLLRASSVNSPPDSKILSSGSSVGMERQESLPQANCIKERSRTNWFSSTLCLGPQATKF